MGAENRHDPEGPAHAVREPPGHGAQRIGLGHQQRCHHDRSRRRITDDVHEVGRALVAAEKDLAE